jgi:hypothetical protein
MIAWNVDYQIHVHLQLYNRRLGRVRPGWWFAAARVGGGELRRFTYEDELLIYIFSEIYIFNYLKRLHYLTRLRQRDFCFNDGWKITESQNHVNKHEVRDYNSEKSCIIK